MPPSAGRQQRHDRPNVGQATDERLQRALGGDFQQGSLTGAWPGCYGGGWQAPVLHDALPVPGFARWILADFLGGPDTGRDEKLAWQIRFWFEGRRCALALQKFGLRLYMDPEGLDRKSAERTATSIVARLEKAIQVAEREVFRPFAEDQVRVGKVTINNQHYQLRTMYEHFRTIAQDPTLAAETDARQKVVESGWNHRVRLERLRFYHGVAMVNAYFSFLEHVLVLVWPFVGYRPKVDDLEAFIGKRWTDKFKSVFDLSAPGTAKVLYDDLRGVAEEYRNTYTHGGFDKERGAFLIHFPHGAVPALMSGIRDRRQFEFTPLPEVALTTITSLFDRVDAWLANGPAGYGMRYARAGFDVPFNQESIDIARAAMSSDDDFEEFLARQGHLIDRMMNMDW